MVNEIERSAAALFHLDPSCSREEWVKTGMAAKSAGLSFTEFHEWSSSGSNYAGEADCQAVWKSFKENGGITSATLFGMAYAHGWNNSVGDFPTVPRSFTPNAVDVERKVVITPIEQTESAKAISIWNRCEPVTPDHPYLLKKNGVPDDVRVYPHTAPPLTIEGQNVAGFLAIPCWDGNKLQTLQFVPGDGKKLNLWGAPFGKGYFVLGDLNESCRVIIVEGIGQAWAARQATGQAAVVAFGSTRMATVANVLRSKYPSAELLILPDRGKEAQAEAIARDINGKWCEMPADKPSNYDANDLMQEAGTKALVDLIDHAKAPAKPEVRFKVLSGFDLMNAPPMRWMVRGVLPSEGLAALYGPSGSGKSFLALDIAASIAGGTRDWFGRRVTQCPVTYCALEGEAGMGKRIIAWSQHHKNSVPTSLRFIAQPFDLLDGRDVAELAQAVQSAGGAKGLVVLDTLNRAAPGADENSSVDMGRIIAAAKQLQNLTGGLVLLVHHTGKDVTKGLRGHSSLYAALDGAIEVNRTDSRREWSVAKSKDDESGIVHAFKLEVVTVSHDEDGEEITSCVATTDDSSTVVKRVKLPSGGNQKIALDALAEPLRKSTEFGKDGAPVGYPCIRLDNAVSLVAERLTVDPKHRVERAREALKGLVARNIYGVKGDWLWRM